jgi:large-conductance mechanosensitive channel
MMTISADSVEGENCIELANLLEANRGLSNSIQKIYMDGNVIIVAIYIYLMMKYIKSIKKKTQKSEKNILDKAINL